MKDRKYNFVLCFKPDSVPAEAVAFALGLGGQAAELADKLPGMVGSSIDIQVVIRGHRLPFRLVPVGGTS